MSRTPKGSRGKDARRRLVARPRASRRLMQERFAMEYLTDLNGTQAAIRCGIRPKSAKVTACRWLRLPAVAAAVAAGQARHLASNDLTAARVLEEMRRCAFADMSAFWVGTGEERRLKPPEEWTSEQGAQVASFEVLIKNAAAGDNAQDLVHKLKLWDKIRALEMLGKHFRLLTDLVEVSSATERLAWLREGLERNARGES